MDAAFVDADPLLVVGAVHLGDRLEQFLLVAAVGVDFGILGSQEVLYEGAAAVAGGAEDGVRCHDRCDVGGSRCGW